MNGNVSYSIIIFLILAALLVIQPWLSRKNVLFGAVFPDESIGKQLPARKIIRGYLFRSGLTVVILLIAWIRFGNLLNPPTAFNLIICGLLIIESFLFFLANRRARQLKHQMNIENRLSSGTIIVETGQKEVLMPISWLIILLPLPLATIITAIIGYPYMPHTLPIHFGLTGPDAWAAKSPGTVLQPIIMEMILCAIVLFTRRAPASVKGNPDAAPGYDVYRKWLNGLLILFAFVTELFALLLEVSFIAPHIIAPALVSRLGVPFLTVPLLIVTGLMFWLFIHRVRDRNGSGPVLNDDDHWIWGMLYFNPSDPSLFIEKRVGIGFTINMARPQAWLIMLAIIAAVILLPIIFRWK